MSILDGAEHAFSAVINGAEHFASDMESLVGHAISELESIGVAAVGDIPALVHYLIKIGEDPVHVISRLASHISSIGGDVTGTLGELTHGILTYGVTGFCKMKVEQALTPMKEALKQNTTQGQMVANVHQNTLNTMQTKLNLLKSGSTSSGMAWQGLGVDSMTVTFEDLSNVINQLSDQIQNDGTQARLNHFCLQVLEGIGILAVGLAIIDVLLVIVSAIVVVATGGAGALAAAPIDGAVLAAEIELILDLVAADLIIWLVGTIAIYVNQHVIHHTTTTSAPAKPQVLQMNLPKSPDLTPEQEVAVEELVRELAKELGVNPETLKAWLQIIMQELGTGMTIEQAKGVIRCLARKGYLDREWSSAWNSVTHHLTPRDLQGAWGDYNGYDTNADHWGEVTNATESLRNLIKNLDGKIADPTISGGKRAFYKALKAAAENTLRYVNNLVTKGRKDGPSTWDDPKGRVPFPKDILNASGCLPK